MVIVSYLFGSMHFLSREFWILNNFCCMVFTCMKEGQHALEPAWKSTGSLHLHNLTFKTDLSDIKQDFIFQTLWLFSQQPPI